MNKHTRSLLFTSTLYLVLAGSISGAQQKPIQDWCAQQSFGDDREGACEVKEFTVPATGATLTVDAAPNGGIAVEAVARRDIRVLARVIATARTKEDAQALLSRVQVTATADRVQAEGPRTEDHQGWYVSYRVEAPEATPLSLRTTNGGISISGLQSRVEFKTVNGGVKLRNLGGSVEGNTTNGGIDVELDGSTWTGDGLNVETSNGGVRLRIPEGYNAHLETGTVNGGIKVNFPVKVNGTIGKSFSTDLGSGGPTVRVRTRNGGVTISRK